MNADELYRKLRSHQVPELIFLCGQEQYLVQRAARLVRQTIFPDGNDDFNDNQFYGKEVTAELILEAAMTYPVFATKRLVTVKEAHLLAAAELEKLLPYLQDPVPETCLLFVADKIDNRRKFFQQLKKSGALIEFKPLSDREMPQYIRHALNQRDVKISVDGLDLFCLMVGGNLHEVHAELDKLFNYIGTATLIDVKDVQAVVSRGRAENIFELGNAVGRGDIAKALTLVMRLSAAGEAPLKILSLLVLHFRRLWKVRELQVQHRPANEIAKVAGVPPFVVDGLIRQGKKFSRNDFLQAFELFLETDLAMKSSGADAGALLESLILRLVKKKSE
ncbi:MAG: DNA polymerase III subunit delta [Desulfuromusa sp.]|jgi:DNA polymerase-3 subunit delta|nr:DNA polymerase III subunit delta [Desulfuromusa sp.]